MSGHSHWSGIKHKKALTDARKAGVFTKLAKVITVATREGGGDPDTNFKLRLAIDKARGANMPKDNIERAIQRGTGELKGEAEIKEIVYEAYGSGNVAMLIKTLTDNTNRTVSEIKNIITKSGGKMVSAGSVGYLFKKVGLILVSIDEKSLDETELKAIEAGAEDTLYSGDFLTIYTKAEELKKVEENLEKLAIKIENSEIGFIPIQKAEIDQDTKLDYEKLLETLDEQDDVQVIYDNL